MKKRIYFLDHLRIFTITMVIVYHVTLLYTNAFEFVQNPVPDGYDPLFMTMTFLINGPMLNSIMFFIAGYFVIGSYKKKGGPQFAKDRLRRLGIPYLFGLLILAPLAQYIANRSWGSNVGLMEFWFTEFFQPETIDPHHLWFIGILLLFSLASIPIISRLQYWNVQAVGSNHHVPSRVYILFLVLTFVLYYGMGFFYEPQVFISFYILDFSPVMLPIYAAYFALGVYASMKMWFTDEHTVRVFPWVVAYAANFLLYAGTLVIKDINPIEDAGNDPLLAFATNGMTFAGVMLLIALFKKFFNKRSDGMLRLSAHSYNTYIVHYLIVYVVVYLMSNINIPIIGKYIFQVILCVFISWIIATFLKERTPLRSWI
jgi:hypothetical protein